MKHHILELPVIRWIWSVKTEALAALLFVSLFAHLAGWIRKIDPQAATFDLGSLMTVAVGLVGVISAIFVFWIVWRLAFPRRMDVWVDSKDGLIADFFTTTPAVRLFLLFGSLWSVILGVGLISMALQ